MQSAQEYFKNNPEVQEVFSTSDGFLFKTQMYAMNHAATITDKEVTKHIREVAVATAAAPVAEVKVVTKTDDGAKDLEKNVSVEMPKITDSPTENMADVIVDAVKETVAKVEETAKVDATDEAAFQTAAIAPTKTTARQTKNTAATSNPAV